MRIEGVSTQQVGDFENSFKLFVLFYKTCYRIDKLFFFVDIMEVFQNKKEKFALPI